MTHPYLIGITGNIACGKTAVMRELAALGVTVIDGDLVYRELTGPASSLVQTLASRFGSQIVNPDGSLNRPELGRIVFSDPNALEDLDQLAHPPVVEEVVRRVRSAVTPVVATDGIKLLESGMGDLCDEIWVVTCDPDEQRRRLMERNAYSAEEAERRIAAQSPVSAKIARADVIIENDGSIDDLRGLVRTAWADATVNRANARY